LSLTLLIISVIIPFISLSWFVINMQINTVRAEAENVRALYDDHICSYKKLVDTMPDRMVLEQQYQFIREELEKINIELEKCRASDKEFTEKFYKFIINKK
jgi:hypothetical protein